MTQDQIQILKEFVLAEEDEAIELLKRNAFIHSDDALESLETFLGGSTDFEIKSAIRRRRSLIVLWKRKYLNR